MVSHGGIITAGVVVNYMQRAERQQSGLRVVCPKGVLSKRGPLYAALREYLCTET